MNRRMRRYKRLKIEQKTEVLQWKKSDRKKRKKLKIKNTVREKKNEPLQMIIINSNITTF